MDQHFFLMELQKFKRANTDMLRKHACSITNVCEAAYD